MADLATLLDATSDDLKRPVVPVGTWKAASVSARLTPSKKPDKNGRDYFRGTILIGDLAEPQDDVLPDEVAAAGESLRGELFENTMFIYNKADMRRFGNVLTGLGVPDNGMSVKDRAAKLKEIRPEVLAEFESETYEGETRSKVTRVYLAA